MSIFDRDPKSGLILPIAEVDNQIRKLRHAVGESEDEYKARKALLDSTAPDAGRAGSDASLNENYRHNPVAANAEFSKKVYFFPEEFNALRRELEEFHRDWFVTVNPLTGTSPAYCMVFDAPQFIGYCNGATGLAVQFDSENVAGICKQFLNAFRAMRGVSAIN